MVRGEGKGEREHYGEEREEDGVRREGKTD